MKKTLTVLAICLAISTHALAADKNDAVAQAAKMKGAVTTRSGAVVIPVKEGKGASPTAANTVRVNYKGTLLDGKVFDASTKPIEFPLNGVIPCWTEGLQKMKVGGKANLVCPSETAYGSAGAPPVIPPNSVLKFEVELLAIVR